MFANLMQEVNKLKLQNISSWLAKRTRGTHKVLGAARRALAATRQKMEGEGVPAYDEAACRSHLRALSLSRLAVRDDPPPKSKSFPQHARTPRPHLPCRVHMQSPRRCRLNISNGTVNSGRCQPIRQQPTHFARSCRRQRAQEELPWRYCQIFVFHRPTSSQP